MKVNVYLNFNGDTEKAFNFYRSVFGGEFTGLQRFKEMGAEQGMSAEDGEKIMHITLPVGENMVLNATDALESMGRTFTAGNNFSLMLEPESKTEADRLFSLLSANGNVEVPMQDMFWGDYYGAFTDQFGVEWMINYSYPR
jgi:PhnB protein